LRLIESRVSIVSLIKKDWRSYFFYFISVLVLLLPVLINGYPLLYSDSGTYLVSGHTQQVPVDRPIAYGLFVRHLSLSWSVFLIVFLQSSMMVFLIAKLTQLTLKLNAYKLASKVFILCSLLALFTGIDFYTSLIVADIFTSAIILSFYLLLFLPREHKLDLIITSIIFSFALVSHLSHLPLLIGLMLVMAIYYLVKKSIWKIYKRYLMILGMILISLFSLSLVNYSFDYGFRLSRSKNMFLAGRLIESGIANEHLKDVCERKVDLPYQELCNYVNQFDQWPTSGHFLFETSSPIYLGECMDKAWDYCWEEKDEAYESLVRDILSKPDLFFEYLKISLQGSGEQLITFGHPHLNRENFDWMIERYYTVDQKPYFDSTQRKAGSSFRLESQIERWVVVISILTLIYLIAFKHKYLNKETLALIWIVCTGILANAFICSAFSNVVDRYQGRVIFLLPLLAFVFSSQVLGNQKIKAQSFEPDRQ